MKIEKEYEKLTRQEAARLLAESDGNPIPGFVFSDNEYAWSEVKELDGVRVGRNGSPFYSARVPHPWRYCARVTEKRVWEAGDTVTTPCGQFGIVRGLDEDGDPWVESTSHAAGKSVWYADEIKPWTPGYGFYHTGERVPDPPEGYELIPEGEEDEYPPGDREYLLACDFNSGWDVSNPKKIKAELNGRFPLKNQIRAYARRKKQTLQLREGAYYRRRDGEVIDSPARLVPPRGGRALTYPWDVGGDMYTDEGHYYADDDYPFPLDLVEEVPDPNPAPKLQIREGAYYRRRDGVEMSAPAVWSSDGPADEQPWDVGGLYYTRDGHYHPWEGENPCDLVEEIPAPTLRIREGARYRRRNGLELSAPARWRPCAQNDSHPWDVGGYSYTEDGHYRSDLVEHQFDLVEEIAPPPPRYVAFDRAEELPDWPVIWMRHQNGNITQITKIRKDHVNGSISLETLFKYYQIAPNRKDWVPAGKEVKE